MIRVNYGDIQKMGQLAVEAGRAEGQVISAQLQQAERESQRSATLQMASINAATQRQIRDIEHQNSMLEFRSWIDQEAEKRSKAWEIEKMELTARNRFDIAEQEFAIKKQAETFMKVQEEDERKRKLSSLDKLFESGEITDEQRKKEKVRIQLSLPSEASPFMPEKGTDAMSALIDEMKKQAGIGGAEKPISKPTAETTRAAVFDLSLPAETRTQVDVMSKLDVSSEDKKKINAAVATKDPAIISKVFEKLSGSIKELAKKSSAKVAEAEKLRKRGEKFRAAFSGGLAEKQGSPLRNFREGPTKFPWDKKIE